MENSYLISRFKDPEIIFKTSEGSGIDFTDYINTLKSFDQLIYPFENEKLVDSIPKPLPGTFDFNENAHFYYSLKNNFITAVTNNRENYIELKIFFDVANKLKAHLWKSANGKFIITEDYLNNLLIKDKQNSFLNKKQNDGLDKLEQGTMWFIIKSIKTNNEFLSLFSHKQINYECFEDCIEETLSGDKLIAINQNGIVMILGLNAEYFIYNEKRDYKNEENNIKIIEYLCKISKIFGEAMYFEYHTDAGIKTCNRCIDGQHFYSISQNEILCEEVFGKEININPIKSIDFSKRSVLDICREWTNTTPVDLIIETIKKKEKVVTFKQENFAITSMRKSL